MLQAHAEHSPACLKVVFEVLVEVQRGLDLYKGAELGVVVFDVVAAQFVFFDECMQTTHRNIMDSHVRIMASTQPYLTYIIKVYNVKLLLPLDILLGRVNLERLNNDKVLVWLLNFEYL